VLAALAAGIHLACDGLASRSGFTSPPYLLLDHAGELFRDLLSLDRTAILLTVSISAAVVNGAIAAMLGVALESARRRRRTLAWVLYAFWVFSGGLMILVYLSPPWAVVAGSLAAGMPRVWLVAWALDRALGEPALTQST
jgi:hypothetical protein